jgi:hypothetical protein
MKKERTLLLGDNFCQLNNNNYEFMGVPVLFQDKLAINNAAVLKLYLFIIIV